MTHNHPVDLGIYREPTPQELDAIEAEWPIIAAELAIVDAEIAAVRVGDDTSELARRRSRRALSHLTRQIGNARLSANDSFGGAA